MRPQGTIDASVDNLLAIQQTTSITKRLGQKIDVYTIDEFTRRIKQNRSLHASKAENGIHYHYFHLLEF